MITIHAAIFSDSSEGLQTHTHECYRLICYYSGNGAMHIMNKSIAVNGSTVVLIPPNVPHSDYVEKNSVEYISVLFDSDKAITDSVLFTEDDEEADIYNELRQVVVFNQIGTDDVTCIRDSLFDAVIAKVKLFASMDKDEKAVYKYKEEIIEKIAQSDFKMNDFMNSQVVTRSNVSRKFKSVTDCTAKQFKDEQKISYAKQLMLHDTEGKHTTKEIAQKCGYEEEFYFSRIFKERTGMSISEFMKKK